MIKTKQQLIQKLLYIYIKSRISQIVQIMSWLWNWFRGNRNYNASEHQHSQILKFCCSDICRYDRQICVHCEDNHKNHTLMDYKKFKQTYGNALEEINCRQKIQTTMREYNSKLLSLFEELLEAQTVKFLEQINKKIYGKNFIQIYKRHLTGKSFYSFLPDFQNSYGDQVNNLISKVLKQKQKKFGEMFKQLVGEYKIQVDQYIIASMPKIRDYPNQSKIDKVKSILPFQCQLHQKFQASKLRFQTNSLHKIGIRGPILLVAQSYKGMIFGGFSPKMFPKDQHYEEDSRGRSFIFSLDHRVRLPLKSQFKKFAIKGGNNLCFGRGDLVIADECNKANISWAQIGRAYQLPCNIKCDPSEWLAGALYFRIVEYEIYEVESPAFMGR